MGNLIGEDSKKSDSSTADPCTFLLRSGGAERALLALLGDPNRDRTATSGYSLQKFYGDITIEFFSFR
ncbi:hypothetical protein L0222_22385 [bacterium]|nr:hypothetical protein [bacterium]